jgi:hypothetical protein
VLAPAFSTRSFVPRTFIVYVPPQRLQFFNVNDVFGAICLSTVLQQIFKVDKTRELSTQNGFFHRTSNHIHKIKVL